MSGTFFGLLAGAGLIVMLFRSRPHNPPIAIEVSWPHFIDDLASALRAGQSISVALFECGQRVHPSAQPVFRHWQQAWKAGCGLEAALEGLEHDLRSPEFSQLTEVLHIVMVRGGSHVSSTLSELARNIRAQEQLIHEVRSRQSVTLNSAKVAVAAPWIVLLLTAGRPEVRSAYLSSTGMLVIVGVLLTSFFSYVAMRKVAEIPALRVMR